MLDAQELQSKPAANEKGKSCWISVISDGEQFHVQHKYFPHNRSGANTQRALKFYHWKLYQTMVRKRPYTGTKCSAKLSDGVGRVEGTEKKKQKNKKIR